MQLNASVYYISPSGSDGSSGSSYSPWRSLSYACLRVFNPGDVIHVKSGVYFVDAQCYLASGVSIEGDGRATTRIITSVVNAPTIVLQSSGGIYGNQHITGIQIDANNLVNCGTILIKGRSNVKIYGCSFINFKSGASHFAGENLFEYVIEIRNTTGGIEIYGNDIEGGIRAFYVTKSTYEYSLDIHHNKIGKDSLSVNPETGIYLCDVDGLYIRNNYFKNLAFQIEVSAYLSTAMKDIFIINNVMFNIGVASDEWWGSGIIFGGLTTETARNINIINNTMIANPMGRNTRIGINLPTVGYATDIFILNNIMEGFRYATIFAAGPDPVIDFISIQNNIFWDNTSDPSKTYCKSDSAYFTNIKLPLNLTQDYLFTDPLFVGDEDFHLSEFSPAIGAGQYVSSVIYDYDNKVRGDIYDVGAYMFGTSTDIDEREKIDLLIYPVPFEKYFTMAIDVQNFMYADMEIYNLEGIVLYRQRIIDIISEIDLNNVPSGIYIVKLTNSNKKVTTIKVIKH